MQTSLVGDLIMGLRETATDPPLSLVAPSGVAVSVTGGSGSLTLFCVVTQLTPWGESAPSTEATGVSAAIGSTFTVSGINSYVATGIKVYFSIAGAGLEDRYIAVAQSNAGGFNISFTLSTAGILPGFPPKRSSAWLPDTDGTALSVSSIYRWINEGLDAATSICEGIRDVTGIPTVAGQAQYQVIGNWRKMSNGFYDGYPFGFGNKFDVFRHSNVTGIVGTMVMNKNSEVQTVEVWPQANRTAGTGTLNVAITATTTTLSSFTPGATSFVLGFGLALLGPYPADPSQCEIIYYSNTGNGNQLVEIQRGMGGTTPQAWPIGTQVSELNVYLSGTRNPQHYVVGQSANVLTLPPSWIDAIRTYLESRFKEAEQDSATAEKLLAQFQAKCKAIFGTKPVLGPRQIQVGQSSGVEVVSGAGGYFGSIILP